MTNNASVLESFFPNESGHLDIYDRYAMSHGVPRDEAKIRILRFIYGAGPTISRDNFQLQNFAMLYGVPAPAPNETKYRFLGRIFGYPECCIDQFESDCAAGRHPAKLRKAYQGFVPCDKCQPIAESQGRAILIGRNYE